MTDMPAQDLGGAVVSLPDEVRKVEYYDITMDILLDGAGTDGKFFMYRERNLLPEDAPPFHVHTREDEVWIVNGGRFRFWLGGDSLDTAVVRDVGPGGVVFGPRNVAHTFQALGEPGDVTILYNSSQIEGYFTGVGKTDARDDSDHVDDLERAGMSVLDRAPVDGK